MPQPSTLEQWATWAFSPSISAILVTLLVGFSLPLLIHLYLYRSANLKELPSFLLAGPSGAGKTSLLTLFANGTLSSTHTSQEPQTALCQLPATTRASADKYRSEHDTSSLSQPQLNIIDTPGHGKLRHHASSTLSTYTSLKGLLFVVDSAAISSTARLTEAAEYLHDLLLLLQRRHTTAKTSRDPQSISVLVVANKQDIFTSLPAALVRTRLEAELTNVRQTRSKRLLDSGATTDADTLADDDDEGNWLGEYGAKEFRFAQMEEHGVDVEVIGGNVVGSDGEKPHVDEWWAWIGEHL